MNKYYLRDKHFLSLIRESDYILKSIYTFSNTKLNRLKSTRLDEIEEILIQRYYNEYRGKYNTAPKWYRKILNKRQRLKSKRKIELEVNGHDDTCYDDNYKGCSWYW